MQQQPLYSFVRRNSNFVVKGALVPPWTTKRQVFASPKSPIFPLVTNVAPTTSSLLRQFSLFPSQRAQKEQLQNVAAAAPSSGEWSARRAREKLSTLLLNLTSVNNKKQNLVILGGGWAGFRLLKTIDLEKYNVFVITPRNHFLFTPLLPGSAAGTVEFRSIIEPLRRARVHSDFHFFEASCEEVDTVNRVVMCQSNHAEDPKFAIQYDKLVVAVGCDVNTFNIPGVKEHCYFMKELKDARRVRSKLIENFERASNPNTPVHLKEQLLNIVVVGAGPTGVELSAEIHDLINQDLRRYFPPETIVDVRMTILEASDTLLAAFDKSLQKQTMKVFTRDGIKVRLHKKVQRVINENTLVLDDGSTVECGMIIWSAGIQARELLRKEH